MSHLEIDRLVLVLSGNATDEERGHAEGCAKCGRELKVWQQRFALLREVDGEEIGDAELHNLRVMFRELGPARSSQTWIARLIHSNRPVAAVRGPVVSSLETFEAGPFEIVMQIRPSEAGGRIDVQGQVMNEDGQAPVGAGMVMTSETGFAEQAGLDDFGEFRVTGIPAGAYRVCWTVGDGVIELPELYVGEPDGAGES